MRITEYGIWGNITDNRTEDWKNVEGGCVGLLRFRLGLDRNTSPIQTSEKGFKTFDSAAKFAKSLPAKEGKVVRIFAFEFNYKTGLINDKISKEEYEKLPDQIPDTGILRRGSLPFNYLTLHQNAENKESWFWESMNQGIKDSDNDKDRADAMVLHKPFAELTDTNHPHYDAVLFFVIYVRADAPKLPRAK